MVLLGVVGGGLAQAPHANDSGFRVVEIDLRLTLQPDLGLIREEVDLRVAGNGVSRLSFRLNDGLIVERSRIDRGAVEHRKGDEGLVVEIDPPLDGERVLSLLVTGRPRRGAEDLVTERWAVLGGDDLWYPHRPESLHGATVRVEAPAGWTVVGPGRPSGDVSRVWSASLPVRALAVAAAPGLALSRSDLPGTDLRVAAPPGVEARSVTGVLSDPMAWLSGALAPYPFDGFNLALVPGNPFHARGSGVAIVPAESPLLGRQDGAALLAGQWFGERLAGNGSWIRAFEAWQAVTYTRDRSLPLPTEIAALRDGYFEIAAGRDVPLSRVTPASPDEVVRGKGSAAPDMIRLIVGDRRFYGAIRDLFALPPGPPRSLEEVRATFEARAGNPLVRAFSEWFDRRGVPRIEAEFETHQVSDDAWEVRLTLTQRNGVWLLPVDVAFVGLEREHRETVRIEDETTRVSYTLPFEPRRLVLDPLHRLFLEP